MPLTAELLLRYETEVSHQCSIVEFEPCPDGIEPTPTRLNTSLRFSTSENLFPRLRRIQT